MDEAKEKEGSVAADTAGSGESAPKAPKQNARPTLQDVVNEIPLESGAPQSDGNVDVAPPKRSFPTPQELKSETAQAGTGSKLPEKMSLKDIPLPEYMKSGKTPVQKLTEKIPTASEKSQVSGLSFYEEHQSHIETPVKRSMREIGAKVPTGPHALNIVAVNTEHRTEIDENGLPRIRTYAADMSAEIKKRGATLASIAGAEREREAERAVKERGAEEVEKRSRRLVLAGAAGVLLLLGAVVIGAALVLTNEGEAPEERTSLIPVNRKHTVLIQENSDLVKALAAERSAAELALGEVEEIIVTRDGRELTGEEIMLILGAPEVLARNTERVFVGLHAFDRNQPILIVVVSAYDLAFDSILFWEDRMGEALGDFFAPLNRTPRPPPLIFSDRVFRNLDVRESQGEWPVLYTFPERDTLIVTTNDNTLREALTRLSISKTRSP